MCNAKRRSARPELRWRTILMGVVATTVILGGVPAGDSRADLFGPSGKDIEEKRTTIRKLRDEMLTDMYAANPDLKKEVENAVGYATFRQTDINLLLLASGNGYGVLNEKDPKKETFMRVASLGGGLGMGVKDLRVIFIFTDKAVMQKFLDEGWQFGGKADAAAKHEDKGASAEQAAKANVDFKDGTVSGGTSSDVRGGTKEGEKSAGASAGQGMKIYQFTESGLALQATVSGTKYWKDTKLND
jgi:hypothetical protein